MADPCGVSSRRVANVREVFDVALVPSRNYLLLFCFKPPCGEQETRRSDPTPPKWLRTSEACLSRSSGSRKAVSCVSGMAVSSSKSPGCVLTLEVPVVGHALGWSALAQSHSTRHAPLHSGLVHWPISRRTFIMPVARSVRKSLSLASSPTPSEASVDG